MLDDRFLHNLMNRIHVHVRILNIQNILHSVMEQQQQYHDQLNHIHVLVQHIQHVLDQHIQHVLNHYIHMIHDLFHDLIQHIHVLVQLLVQRIHDLMDILLIHHIQHILLSIHCDIQLLSAHIHHNQDLVLHVFQPFFQLVLRQEYMLQRKVHRIKPMKILIKVNVFFFFNL